MRHVGTVASRELRSLFVSPVAYVVLTLYAVLAGFFFLTGVVAFIETVVQAQTFQQFEFLREVNLNDHLLSPFLGTMGAVLLFVTPGITMGLFATERANGTDELLMTSPLSIGDVVLGKYLAAAAFVGLLVVIAGFYAAILFFYGNPEPARTGAGLMALALMGLTYAAIGAFASSVTRSQIIAFVLAFVLLLVQLIIGAVAQVGALGQVDWFGRFLQYASMGEHFETLLQGLVDTADLAYFVAVTAIFLILTRAAVESARWR